MKLIKYGVYFFLFSFFLVNYYNVVEFNLKDRTWDEHVCEVVKQDEDRYVYLYDNCFKVVETNEEIISSRPCWIKYKNNVCQVEIEQPRNTKVLGAFTVLCLVFVVIIFLSVMN